MKKFILRIIILLCFIFGNWMVFAEDASARFRIGNGERRQTMFVNSPEGLRVRNAPSLSAQQLTGLPDKIAVKIWRVGELVTIDDITAPWVQIYLPVSLRREAGTDMGWVFGGYLAEAPKDSLSAVEILNKNGADFDAVKRAAENGSSKAQYKLGEYYKLGLGVKQDYAKAAEWYKKAAEQDEPMAFRLLGDLYMLGLGVKKDKDMAWQYINKAKLHYGSFDHQDYWAALAEKDIPVYISPGSYSSYGLSNLDCLFYGFTEMMYEDMNPIFGAQYFLEAAKNGCAEAQLCLAKLYANDDSIEGGVYEAEVQKWYARAAAQGRYPDDKIVTRLWQELDSVMAGKSDRNRFMDLLIELVGGQS